MIELTHDQEQDVYATINNTTGCIGLKSQIKELSEADWMNEGQPMSYDQHKQDVENMAIVDSELKAEKLHRFFNEKYTACGGLYTRTKWCQANKVIKDTYRALVNSGVTFPEFK
jgi:hypothetical protein